MRNFRNTIFKITLVVVCLLIMGFYQAAFSIADTCHRGAPVFTEKVIWDSRARYCPNSKLGCTFGIKESKYDPAFCAYGININSTISPCRIRESQEASSSTWNWPEPFYDTLKGPCFPVIATAPCGSPHEITIWFQWVDPLGNEAACDASSCFFCEDDIDGIPDCGLENSNCPS